MATDCEWMQIWFQSSKVRSLIDYKTLSCALVSTHRLQTRRLSRSNILQLNCHPTAATSVFVEEILNFCFKSMRFRMHRSCLEDDRWRNGKFVAHDRNNFGHPAVSNHCLDWLDCSITYRIHTPLMSFMCILHSSVIFGDLILTLEKIYIVRFVTWNLGLWYT